MKNNRLFRIFVGIIVISMLQMMFVAVPRSYAQTIQDWTDPINISNSGLAYDPLLLVDGNGVFHVIWIDKIDGYKYTESKDGLSWTSPRTVKFPFSLVSPPPMFVVDSEGLIHIFWQDDKNALYYGQATPENFDIPSAWRITNLAVAVLDFDAVIDSDGILHLAYLKNIGTELDPPGIYYRRSGDRGFTWPFASKKLYTSLYFRSLTLEAAHVRIAEAGGEVYIVWDDRNQKLVFMAISADSGLNWDPAKEIITSQASLGFETPYNADIDILEDKILITWQVGAPGGRCTPYSWSSSDGGGNWDEPVKILAESSQCPEKSEFIPIDPRYSVSLFTIQGDLAISVWNGSEWSNPEFQTGASSITNPTTFDTVLLGCKQAVPYDDRLFVVGCDQGSDGDIWFIARQLDPLENLFPLPSAWSGAANVTTTPQTITSLSSIVDNAGNAHVLWVQSSSTTTDTSGPQIEYARWDGQNWTSPVPVITNLSGLPLNLSLQIDNRQRLLLCWINQQTGEMLFTLANSERANFPLEWMQPVILSSASQLTNSPDMLVDASGRIVITYAITLNEERGIYIIQSTDLGETWSPSIKVFDAIAADWEMVDQPKLGLTEDGRLHLLFTKYTLLGSQQSVGLYYSQSSDGGSTWTYPESVTEQSVQWSSIVAFKESLYRFWQEKNKSVISGYFQVSSDGGTTWSSPRYIPNDPDIISTPAISVDWTGKIHLLQIMQKDVRTLQEWEWSYGLSWQLLETRKLAIPKQVSPIKVRSGITSQGTIYALMQIENPLNEVNEGIESSLLYISRTLELTEETQPFLASISTPVPLSLLTANPDFQPTPTLVPPLVNLNDPQPTIIKNIVGLFLIIFVMFLILVFIVPSKAKSRIK